MVVAVTAMLEGEAAEWVADLHSEHARELPDAGLFLEALRVRFEDRFHAQRAEGELLSLKQRGHLALEYVWEFCWVAGRLWAWLERLLVHQFRWVWTVIYARPVCTGASHTSFRSGSRWSLTWMQAYGSSGLRVMWALASIGLRTDCLVVSGWSLQPLEHQTPQLVLLAHCYTFSGATNWDAVRPSGQLMVSQPISPFTISITIVGPCSGWCGTFGALIDSGCVG